MCREKYHSDRLKLLTTNEFEIEYRSEQDAIRWYTKESFLYCLLNEILRVETINLIVKLCYFIQDLHNLLALMQVDYLKSLRSSNCALLTLYRSQVMTWKDLENQFRLNKGNLVSMNSFLSTTTDQSVARMFSGDGLIKDSERYVSVLYEITFDIRLPHSVPFAELVGRNNFDDENEVLFSMGAIFRTGDTYEENRYLWTVGLTLTTEEHEQWNVLTEHLQQDEEEESMAMSPLIIVNPRKKRRSRSSDDHRFSKRDFPRIYWPDAF
jgi:hypothetical protein